MNTKNIYKMILILAFLSLSCRLQTSSDKQTPEQQAAENQNPDNTLNTGTEEENANDNIPTNNEQTQQSDEMWPPYPFNPDTIQSDGNSNHDQMIE